MAEPLRLSVVITTYTLDRLRDISELLDSIRAQKSTYVETIIVVERSMELLNALNKYVDENIVQQFKLIFNDGEKGLSAARNLGYKHATGDIIAFIDDDAILFPDWATETLKSFSDNMVIGITGPIMPSWQDGVAEWFPNEFDWILSCTGFADINESKEVRNAFGTNMSFRREAFKAGGLFLTNLGAKGGDKSGKHELVGDETEFSIRVVRKTGKHILFNPKVRVKHKVYRYRITPPFIARRAYWEGYTKALFNKSFQKDKKAKNVLNVEHQLLRRIIFKLIPSILVGFFIRPINAWRKLSVTVNAIFFVGLGYFIYSVRSLNRQAPIIVYEMENINNEATRQIK